MTRLGLLSIALWLQPSRAIAQPPMLSEFGGPRGFGTACLGANDDASSEAIDLREAFPAGLRWGQDRLFTVYVNNNGNVSFEAALGDFTPTPFEGLTTPVIAAYWADLDSRPAGCGATEDPGTAEPCEPESATDNTVWWHLEPGRFVATWHRMGRYQCDPSARVSAQLVIESAGCLSAGDFDVTIRHAECGFTSGDASKSEGQTVHAQVGFGGAGVDSDALASSLTTQIASEACDTGGGVHRFTIRSTSSDQQFCIGAGGSCETGADGVCAIGALSCSSSETECVALRATEEETCDGLDNDCDGRVDETNECELGGCVAGNCAPFCSEGICPIGLACDGTYCLPTSCRDVQCEEGTYCRQGECIDSCEGVFCPEGQSCVAGRCQDLCALITCDGGCEVCHDGRCTTPCIPGDCEAGSSCVDGICRQSSCLDVECSPGLLCRAGACEAACEKVRCPRGYACDNGSCELEEVVSMRQVDPGIRRQPDASSCRMGDTPHFFGWVLAMIALAISRLRAVRGSGYNATSNS